ncbi:hypothetical protein JR316_0008308 [Psilocybe cubensis]|uniref:Uncharacterized protein n=2 Tax=Psilocybe cubensis TaxID=181762 RepID=A0ACB8GW21_PSICU|nr:hypothetical protein JR316_0008308 [Psilocybe cubensis]KAH9479713.1 hypothetical protein JR316_0008308 [Psilocybe cubensis]
MQPATSESSEAPSNTIAVPHQQERPLKRKRCSSTDGHARIYPNENQRAAESPNPSSMGLQEESLNCSAPTSSERSPLSGIVPSESLNRIATLERALKVISTEVASTGILSSNGTSYPWPTNLYLLQDNLSIALTGAG